MLIIDLFVEAYTSWKRGRDWKQKLIDRYVDWGVDPKKIVVSEGSAAVLFDIRYGREIKHDHHRDPMNLRFLFPKLHEKLTPSVVDEINASAGIVVVGCNSHYFRFDFISTEKEQERQQEYLYYAKGIQVQKTSHEVVHGERLVPYGYSVEQNS